LNGPAHRRRGRSPLHAGVSLVGLRRRRKGPTLLEFVGGQGEMVCFNAIRAKPAARYVGQVNARSSRRRATPAPHNRGGTCGGQQGGGSHSYNARARLYVPRESEASFTVTSLTGVPCEAQVATALPERTDQDSGWLSPEDCGDP
jgi:hypothetical protein